MIVIKERSPCGSSVVFLKSNAGQVIMHLFTELFIHHQAAGSMKSGFPVVSAAKSPFKYSKFNFRMF